MCSSDLSAAAWAEEQAAVGLLLPSSSTLFYVPGSAFHAALVHFVLESGLVPLIDAARDLLEEQGLLVLSTYAVGYSPLAFQNLLGELQGGEVSVGELVLPEQGGQRLLPAGFCARWTRGLELPD